MHSPDVPSTASHPARWQRRRRTFLRWFMVLVGLCVIAAIVSFVALRRFRLPAPTGPYAVGTCILNLTDQSRPPDGSTNSSPPASGPRRDLVVQLWYPALPSNHPLASYARWQETKLNDRYEALLQTNSRWNAPFASSGAPFPVLIFGHRWGGQRTQNTDLAEDLASHGYVVAAVDHPYNSSRVLLPDGRVIRGDPPQGGPDGPNATAAQQIAFWNSTLKVWAADDRFVLDQLAAQNTLPASAMHGRLDTNHAGAFGHSFGGAVALRLCGLDPRIKAAVNLDGWTFGGLADRTAAQPVLIEYEESGAVRDHQLLTLPHPGTVEDQLDRADIAAVNSSLSRFGGYEMYIAGTQHLDFTDQPLLPPLRRTSYTGPITPLRVQKIIRETVLGFFNQTLRGQPSPLLDPSQSAFPDVQVERWPAPPTGAPTAPAPSARPVQRAR